MTLCIRSFPTYVCLCVYFIYMCVHMTISLDSTQNSTRVFDGLLVCRRSLMLLVTHSAMRLRSPSVCFCLYATIHPSTMTEWGGDGVENRDEEQKVGTQGREVRDGLDGISLHQYFISTFRNSLYGDSCGRRLCVFHVVRRHVCPGHICQNHLCSEIILEFCFFFGGAGFLHSHTTKLLLSLSAFKVL